VSSFSVIFIFVQFVELESTFSQMPTKLSAGGNIGVPVGPGTKVGVGVSVVVGKVCVVGVFVGNENVGREIGVFVGIALCGSASPVLTVDMWVPMISA